MKISKLIFILILFVTQSRTDGSPTVEIPNGKLIGKAKSNHVSFESIPYAEPPIGENRFEPAKPFEGKWNEPRDASKQIHQQCIQYDMSSNSAQGSEDCLYLNVYTPSLDNGKSFPVIIYIHGGSFRAGNDHMLGEDILMEHGNFVLVTLNYRLGPIGFLSTNCTAIPGNMGLKDQRLAIKWIKENIAKFNGNPDEILLSGFSSGGASVHLHLLSKGIEDLIKVGVSFGGNALSTWSFDFNPLKKTEELAKYLKCPTDNTMEMKNCLKKVSAEDLVQATNIFMKFLNYPITSFAPVIESSNIADAIITDSPENILKSGQFSNIPWLVSRCIDEAAIFSGALLASNDKGKMNLVEFNERFDEIAPDVFFYTELEKDDKEMFTSYLRRAYHFSRNMEVTEDTYWDVQEMMSDEIMINSLEEGIKLHREFGKGKTFYYVFDNPPPFGFANIISNRKDYRFGTIHGDDVLLIFKSHIRDDYPWTDIEKKISNNLVKMLEGFVKTGVPTYGDLQLPIDIDDKISPPKALMITDLA